MSEEGCADCAKYAYHITLLEKVDATSKAYIDLTEHASIEEADKCSDDWNAARRALTEYLSAMDGRK